jgi:hypothetical protein
MARKAGQITRAEVRAADKRLRSAWSEAKRIVKAEEQINRMPQAAALREAACRYGALSKSTPVDADDSAVREANRRLMDAAVHFVRALRGEE